MYHLILMACLASAPEICAPILLPAAEGTTRQDCTAQAQRISGDWLAGHNGLTAAGTDCVPIADLPSPLPLQKIAPGVFVFSGDPVQMEDSPDGHIANLGVVIGDASVAVIDAGVSRSQGQRLYAAIRRLTDKPVSHMILTHMHPDHALGASVFQEAGAEVIGHHALPLSLELRGQSYLDSIARLFPPTEVLGTEIVLPDRTVDGQAQIDLGGRVLTLRTAPTAHTDNDLWVWDATTGTLFSGDLIFRELTPILDGSLRGWLKWLGAPPDPLPRRIVPGHGPVARTWKEAVTPQEQFLNALENATRAEIDAGQPMSAAVPKISNALETMVEHWNSFRDSVARDATAAYKELEWE